jgi:hypothetical protein
LHIPHGSSTLCSLATMVSQRSPLVVL